MFTAAQAKLSPSPLLQNFPDFQNGFTHLHRMANEIVLDETIPKKIRAGNFFKKPNKQLNKLANGIVDQFDFSKDLIWHFEIFNAEKPVGLHNDRNYFSEINELCEVGLIVPLEFSGDLHCTRFYDLFIDQKVNWDGEGHFRTLDKEVVEYDVNRLENFVDVSWEIGKIIFFSSLQIHEAIFPREKSSFKLSLNGLGYSKPF